ncbi:hypothetical protein G6N74_29515 [Mesorhizobium sp. CGMCC 1.15528]|uniref:Uncharacterized protein n=1 Tax=Mesorhizobium zhangyense TaxID=1776730 RepID=A0A7C9RC61_9HYPH|nr:hypothetical protein [Mesorhizobium zhangyense]NGN45195.1 hypothetical protein [Mesorhizobium zhangyense]
MAGKIEVMKLPRGEYTKDGAYYATVDGRNIGMPGRAFWETREQANACGVIFVAMREAL